MIYFSAPVFVSWCMATVAARQRLKMIWPTIGLALVALIGCTVRVHAIRPERAGVGGGHVSLGIGLGPDIGGTLVYTRVIVSLAVLSYLAWKLRTTYFARA
jgi:predicted signal transduction protein with EAL and GGDEF domain